MIYTTILFLTISLVLKHEHFCTSNIILNVIILNTHIMFIKHCMPIKPKIQLKNNTFKYFVKLYLYNL